MFRWLLLNRIYERPAFIFEWEFRSFVFCSIAAATSQKQVVPFNSQFIIGGCALWLKMLNVTVINVSDITFTIRTFPVKHIYQRLFDIFVLIFVLRFFPCGIGRC